MSIDHAPTLHSFFLNQERWLERLATATSHPDRANTRLWQEGSVSAVRSGQTGVIMLHETSPDSTPDIIAHDNARDWLRFHQSGDVLVWTRYPRPAMDVLMLAQGYNESFAPWWMERDLREPLPPMPDAPVEISFATAEHVQKLRSSTGIPYVMRDQLDATLALSQDHDAGQVFWLIAHQRKHVVGQAIVNLTGDLAGLYNVAVDGQLRRRGIGAALTHASMQVARDHGASVMCLNSTGMGRGVYERCGFQMIGEGQTWFLPARRLRNPASIGDMNAAYAVGRGDISALEGVELPRLLPNEDTPLQFAARYRQADTARWLLRHGEEPDIIALWQLDLREEAKAAMHERMVLNRPTGSRGATPLHHAVEHGWGTLVLLLIDAGADLTAKDSEYGSTPLDWAHALNKPTIAAVLRRAGAR